MKLFDLFKKKSINFAPVKINHEFIGFGSLTPNWLNTREKQKLFIYYSNIPILNSAVNYGAEIFQKCDFQHIKKTANGEEILNSDISKLLKNPNLLQNWNEFLEQYWIFKKVFGTNIIYSLRPSGMNKIKTLWNLPVHLLSISFTDKHIYSATDLNEIIKEVCQGEGKYKKNFELENLRFINESTIEYNEDRYILGQSKIESQKYALSNIIGNYEARQTLVTNRGMQGLISNDQNAENGGGVAPLTDEEVKEINEKVKGYGLNPSQNLIWFTTAAVKFQKTGFDYEELGLDEMKKSDVKDILNAFGLSELFFNSTEGSTFNNVQELRKNYIMNIVQPEWETLEYNLNQLFKLPENEYIKIDFSFIPELQIDKNVEIEHNTKQIDNILRINNAVLNNEITRDAAINMLVNMFNYDVDLIESIINIPVIETVDNNSDTIDAADAKIQEQTLEAQANLRGTVGGVQGILAVQQSVAQGTTEYNAAINILVEIYGFDEQTAKQILGDKRNANQANNIQEPQG